MKTEIDYLFDGINVAFTIKYITEFHVYLCRSPFIFESTEEAYDAAVIELSNN